MSHLFLDVTFSFFHTYNCAKIIPPPILERSLYVQEKEKRETLTRRLVLYLVVFDITARAQEPENFFSHELENTIKNTLKATGK